MYKIINENKTRLVSAIIAINRILKTNYSTKEISESEGLFSMEFNFNVEQFYVLPIGIQSRFINLDQEN